MTGPSETQSHLPKFDSPHQELVPVPRDEVLSGPSNAYSRDSLAIELLIKEYVGQSVEHGAQKRKLGIMFRDLRVAGLGAGVATRHNLASLFYLKSILNYIKALRHPPIRDIISGFDGVVFPGEMLLVLGRPGSGCSTLLKTLANHRGDYQAVLGDVFYDSFTSKEINERYRGDVIYCPEDDVHFPTLKVHETLEFASTMRTPSCQVDNQTRATRATQTAEVLMRIFGLEHASNTLVGDASLRGISGGEKKRVSIAEVMSARGKLVCWDNSTRGLDASTALEFIQALRVATNAAEVTTIVSIYQVGEQLYNLFDKVCIIYEGKMAYFGPAKEAKQYFMDMGYEPQNRQTTADFLVASTDPNGRRIRPGFQGIIPRTADEAATRFKTSAYGQLNRSSMDSYYELYVNKPDLKRAYDLSATNEHAPHAPNSRSYMLSIPMQVHAVMRRRWQILKGDWLTQAAQVGLQNFQAIFVGTIFLRVSTHTSAYYSRGGAMYFALFSGSTFAMAEILGLFFQRPIVLRHQKGALYYPFIEGLAYTIVDAPITSISLSLMSVTFYFLMGLQQSAGQFFTFLLFMLSLTLVNKICFRSIAACSKSESTAIGLAGVTILYMVLYTGYAIPPKDIVGALRWAAYLNPLRYTFEAMMVNEFHTINGTCTTLVPSGPGYENITLANQVCTTIGSQPGMATVPGDAYVSLSYGYSYSHLWRNLGLVWAFGFGLLGSFLFFTQYNKRTERDTTITLFKEGSDRVTVHHAVDEESATPGNLSEKLGGFDTTNTGVAHARRSEVPGEADIFSWKNTEYDVPVFGGGTRKLLNGVSGYAAPGKLIALMGESGAGKTTLLNVLAQRVSVGVVSGDCLLRGHPLPADFRAQTGYVQQMDTHVPESTVREALLFSARLRQPGSVPAAEKEAYVDKCLKMCGLENYADAIVGSLGVEHRKRATIGVELAAKPKLLLFLDEPTSGLDSQSAWAIMMCLRDLANNGQAIVCSIHQPSGELFQLFDKLLLLRKGGQTVYFGDIGERSMTMIEYFQRHGAPRCAADANPAEYMLDVIGAGATATCTTDWNQIWKDSPEATKLDLEVERIREEGLSLPAVGARSHSEFASSWMKQLLLLVHRGFVCYWRNPIYIYSRLIVFTAAGIIVGFTFFKAPDSLQGYQDKLFSIFLMAVFCIPMTLQLVGKFIETRTVYEVRERPSRMFSWSAFLVSQILIEVPWNMLANSLYFVCWYWTCGFPTSRAGFTYLLFCVVFPWYYTTFLQAVAVGAPNGPISALLVTGLYSCTIVFAGILQPYSQLGWWRWLYHLSPMTYVIEALLGQIVGNELITCATIELVTIEPPSGLSCSAYMDPYMSFAGGYLTNPDATASCAYCPFQTTNAWMEEVAHASYGNHWRDLGLLCAYTAFNILCMFVCMYVFRIRKDKQDRGLLARLGALMGRK